MSKPDDAKPARDHGPIRRLAVVAGIALAGIAGALWQWPVGAAGVAERALPSVPPGPVVARKPPGTYQLRCWQYGRLLFDEGPVTLGPEAREGAKMVALDRNGGAVIVTEAGEATCIARPSPPPPNLALPR
ncbi:MAG TPA: hypothetical protein VGF26_15360 [Ramlibacter sp.]